MIYIKLFEEYNGSYHEDWAKYLPESFTFTKGDKTYMCALPCPFCGSDTEIETTTFGDSMTDNFRVNCKQKGHSLDWWSDTVDEAILVWNERQ